MAKSFEESLKRVARLHGLRRECALYEQAKLQPDKDVWFADQLTRLYREDFEAAMRQGHERAIDKAAYQLDRIAEMISYFLKEYDDLPF